MQEAAKAVKEMDQFRLDKSHLIRVYLVDDLDRLSQVPLEYNAPPIHSFDAEVRRFVTCHATHLMRLRTCLRNYLLAVEAQRDAFLDDGQAGQRPIFDAA